MDPDYRIVPCGRCGARNRIPRERLGDRATCGKCHAPISPAHFFPDRTVDVTDKSFAGEIEQFPGPVILEFHAPWCGYCRMLSPLLDRLAAEYAGRVKFAKLNVDENPETASRYGIRSTPVLFFFRNGDVRDQIMGAVPKPEIERRLNSIL